MFFVDVFIDKARNKPCFMGSHMQARTYSAHCLFTASREAIGLLSCNIIKNLAKLSKILSKVSLKFCKVCRK